MKIKKKVMLKLERKWEMKKVERNGEWLFTKKGERKWLCTNEFGKKWFGRYGVRDLIYRNKRKERKLKKYLP